MGGFWYGGPVKPCPGDGCTNRISFTATYCPVCVEQQQRMAVVGVAVEIVVGEQGRVEVERLEKHLAFEAWYQARYLRK